MQDNYAVGGRFFTSGGGDRRLRPHNHLNHQAALKCPRCESLNTKFCYYNNYNLSQPRHFCKGCRRYWTKGGVLRSVPVGGGCRKTKRSKPKSGDPEAKSKSQSSSSTDSSSLTIGSKTVTTASYSAAGKNLNPNFDDNQPLMNPLPTTDDEMFTADIPAVELAPAAEISPSFASDGTTKADDVSRGDWWIDTGGGDDQDLFDLTAAIDPCYWSVPQWNDHEDHSINYRP